MLRYDHNTLYPVLARVSNKILPHPPGAPCLPGVSSPPRDFPLCLIYPTSQARSQPGTADFFEQGTSNYFVETIRRVAAARTAAGDARPAWFLDVGANIGVHSAAVASAGVPVLSVEGYPTSAARVACTKALNKWDHMLVVPEAVTAAPGKVCFAVRDEQNQGMNWLDGSAAHLENCPAALLVQGRGLSDMIELYAPRTLVPPTVVKVDIEGACRGRGRFLLLPAAAVASSHLRRAPPRPVAGSELIMLKSFQRHLSGEHAGARGAALLAWPEAPAAEQHKWRPEVFVFELRPQLLVVHDGATIQDVIKFMHGFGYRAFYADGVGELTHLVKEPDAAKAEAEIAAKMCPNFMFLRGDLDVEQFSANPRGCLERRR